MCVFHDVSSPADPDQPDDHQPRPSVTIRQHAQWAAVVGLMDGPTTLPSRGAARTQAMRNQARGVCNGARGGSRCARRSVPSDIPLRRSRFALRSRGWPSRPGERTRHQCPGAGARGRADGLPPAHGRGFGRADHDPDQGLRVLTVTVVGVHRGGDTPGPARQPGQRPAPNGVGCPVAWIRARACVPCRHLTRRPRDPAGRVPRRATPSVLQVTGRHRTSLTAPPQPSVTTAMRNGPPWSGSWSGRPWRVPRCSGWIRNGRCASEGGTRCADGCATHPGVLRSRHVQAAAHTGGEFLLGPHARQSVRNRAATADC